MKRIQFPFLEGPLDHRAVGGDSIILVTTEVLWVRKLHVDAGVSIILAHVSSNDTYNIARQAASVKPFSSEIVRGLSEK